MLFLVPEPWGPTQLVANSLGASDSIKVPQDNECVTTGTPKDSLGDTSAQYIIEFDVEPYLFT